MRQNSRPKKNKLALVPSNIEGRIYCSSGITRFYSESDMVCLAVDPADYFEIGVFIPSGEIVYFPKTEVSFL